MQDTLNISKTFIRYWKDMYVKVSIKKNSIIKVASDIITTWNLFSNISSIYRISTANLYSFVLNCRWGGGRGQNAAGGKLSIFHKMEGVF